MPEETKGENTISSQLTDRTPVKNDGLLTRLGQRLRPQKEEVPLKTEYEDVADELARNGDFVADYIRATNNNEEVKSPNSPSLSPEATDYLNSYAFKMKGIVNENNKLYSALERNYLLKNMGITTEEQDGILIFEQLCDGNFPTGGTKLLRRPWGVILYLDTIEDIRQFHGNKSSHTYWSGTGGKEVKIGKESHILRYGVVTQFPEGTLGYRPSVIENSVPHEFGHGEFHAVQKDIDLDRAAKVKEKEVRFTRMACTQAKDELLQDLISPDVDERTLSDAKELTELHSPADASGYGNTSMAGDILFYWSLYKKYLDTNELVAVKKASAEILKTAIGSMDQLIKHKGGYTKENREWARYFLWIHPLGNWSNAVSQYLNAEQKS